MKLLILLVLAFGSTAFAKDPNNTTLPKHLVSEYKEQTCAFSAKQTAKQAADRNYNPAGKARK